MLERQPPLSSGLDTRPGMRTADPPEGKHIEKYVETPWVPIGKMIYSWWVFHIFLYVYRRVTNRLPEKNEANNKGK
jgi:hypothetical protein